jgi:hypothetical protein
LIRALAALLLVLVLLIAGLAGALLWFPGALLRAGLWAAGIETVAFDALHLGLTKLDLDGLRIGAPPEQRLWHLRIRYQLRDLVHGRIGSVEADGLELRGRLADGQLELAGLASKGSGEASLGLPVWPDEMTLRSAEIELQTPWGELRLPFSAELHAGRPEATFTVRIAGGQLINGAGRLNAGLDLQGHLPIAPDVALGRLSAEGHLHLDAEHLALPDLASSIDGQGEVTFELADRQVDARIGPAAAAVGSLGARLASLQDVLPTPWQIRLGDRTGPVYVTGPLDPHAAVFTVAGAVDLTAGRARLAADLEANLRTDPTGRFEGGGAKTTVSVDQLHWKDFDLANGRLRLQADGSAGRWQGTADLELTGGGAPAPQIAIAGAHLSQKLAVSLANDRFMISTSEPGRLAVERLTWAGGGRAGPLAFRLEPGDSPLLAATFRPDGGVAWQQSLRAKGEAFDLVAGAVKGRAQLADLSVDASGDQRRLDSAMVKIAGSRLELPGQQITLDGIATELALSADGLTPRQTIPVTVASISHGGKPAWFAPLALRGTLRPNGELVDFEARISRTAGEPVLTLQGRQDLARGEGQAQLKLSPLTFAPGKLQPAGLAPVLGQRLRDVTGKIALDGKVSWGKDHQVQADLALLLDSLGFTAGPARFEQVNGVVHVDRLWPPTTPTGQQLAIGLLDLGLPLTDGLIGFRIEPDETLAVEQLHWSFAGGTVSAQPFRVGSATSDIKVTLTANGLDLSQLFALTRLDGLSGEGRIHGSLPVRVKDGVAVIEGGELETDQPGWLRYRPATPPGALQAGGANMNLLLQALENFHYEALKITLDGRTDATMQIKLHLRGANPDLYGGYPIEFNLNLQGDLANILRSGLATYQIPEHIREQMQGFHR